MKTTLENCMPYGPKGSSPRLSVQSGKNFTRLCGPKGTPRKMMSCQNLLQGLRNSVNCPAENVLSRRRRQECNPSRDYGQTRAQLCGIPALVPATLTLIPTGLRGFRKSISRQRNGRASGWLKYPLSTSLASGSEDGRVTIWPGLSSKPTPIAYRTCAATAASLPAMKPSSSVSGPGA